jgi:hypothetical protein
MSEYKLTVEELNIKLNEICSSEELDDEQKMKEMRKIIEDSGRSQSWAYNKSRMLVDDEFKKNVYASLRKGWVKRYNNNDEFRKNYIKYLTEYNTRRYQNNEQYREKSKEYSRNKYNNNEDYRAKRIEQNKEAYYKKHPESVGKEKKGEKIITEDGIVRYKYVLTEEQMIKRKEADRLRYLKNKSLKQQSEIQSSINSLSIDDSTEI